VEKKILHTGTGYCKCEEVKRCRIEVTLVLVLAVFLHLSLAKVAVDGLTSDSHSIVCATVLKDLKLISGL
jgi:hypothetical protein